MKAMMIFNHYASILDELIEESDFFKNYFQCPFSLDEDVCWVDYEDCRALFENNTSICFGATRGCFIDDAYDYVVKFDLVDAQERGSCSDEVLIYDAAAQNGLEKFFAQPIYLGTYTKKIKFYTCVDFYDFFEYSRFFDETSFCEKLQSIIEECNMEKEEITISIPLYAYPRAGRHDFYVYEKDRNETYRSISRSNSPLVEREAGIGYAFVSLYGEEIFDALTEFCDEHEINDLHTGNVMEINGELVFTDYCGYRDY